MMLKKKKLKSKALEKEDQYFESILAESGWKDVLTEAHKTALQSAAQAHLLKRKKEARVNLRMTSEDVDQIRQLAAREGIGYQTLMVSVLHKFAQGSLVDKSLLDQLTAALKQAV